MCFSRRMLMSFVCLKFSQAFYNSRYQYKSIMFICYPSKLLVNEMASGRLLVLTLVFMTIVKAKGMLMDLTF